MNPEKISLLRQILETDGSKEPEKFLSGKKGIIVDSPNFAIAVADFTKIVDGNLKNINFITEDFLKLVINSQPDFVIIHNHIARDFSTILKLLKMDINVLIIKRGIINSVEKDQYERFYEQAAKRGATVKNWNMRRFDQIISFLTENYQT